MEQGQKLRVICLPYAGGSATAYQPLRAFWPKHWEISTLELPGRGRRLNEPLLTDLDALVEDCWQQISFLTDSPYVLFGHSLGATLAYLLTHRIRARNGTLPVQLILSGTDAPSIPAKQPYRYQFTRSELKTELKKYGGMPAEVLEDQEFFDFFTRIIRADLKAIETWIYHQRPPLKVPACVITGTQEEMSPSEVHQWQEEFLNPVKFIQLPGRHFYLFEQAAAFVELLASQAERYDRPQPTIRQIQTTC